MKTLYLLRHAKSSRDDPGLADHDRPLADRGRKAAPSIAAWLRAHATRPDLVMCSTARRAQQTWALITPELSPAPKLELRRDLYEAEGADLIEIVRTAPASVRTLMLIGHNPAMEDAADLLAGPGDRAALKTMRGKYPTAAVAELCFDLDDWRAVDRGTGVLARFVRPEDVA